MRRGIRIHLTVISILFCIGGPILLCCGLFVHKPVPQVGTVSELDEELNYFYLEDIEVQGRYVYMTDEEIISKDRDTGVDEIRHKKHLYPDSEKNPVGTLYYEYYVAVIKDAAGNAYVIEISTDARSGMCSPSDTFPKKISGCFKRIKFTPPKQSDRHSPDPSTYLSADALLGCSESIGAPCADFVLSYTSSTVEKMEAHHANEQKAVESLRIIYGIGMIVIGVVLVIILLKDRAERNPKTAPKTACK